MVVSRGVLQSGISLRKTRYGSARELADPINGAVLELVDRRVSKTRGVKTL